MRLFANVIRQMERRDVLALEAGTAMLLGSLGVILLGGLHVFIIVFALLFLAAFPLTWVSAFMIMQDSRSRREYFIAKTALICSPIGLILMFIWTPTDLTRLLILPLVFGSSTAMGVLGFRQYMAVRNRFFPSRYR